MGYYVKGNFYEPDDYVSYMENNEYLWDMLPDNEDVIMDIILNDIKSPIVGNEDIPPLVDAILAEDIEYAISEEVDIYHEKTTTSWDRKHGEDVLTLENIIECQYRAIRESIIQHLLETIPNAPILIIS